MVALYKTIQRLCRSGCTDIIKSIVDSEFKTLLDESSLIVAGRYGQIETFKYILNEITYKSTLIQLSNAIYPSYDIWIKRMVLNNDKELTDNEIKEIQPKAAECRRLLEEKFRSMEDV